MRRSYKPTVSSFVNSILWDISPATVALVGYYFTHEKASEKGLGWLVVVVTVAMCLWSLLLLLPTLTVHSKRVTLDERSISVTGLFGTTTIGFSQIDGAVMRERVNLVSRTDRLIIIHSVAGQLLTFNPSTLSRKDEEDFLRELRKHVPLEVVRDKPTL
jgi:uncharacterized membrane protein YhaH (DUF805 family)